MSAADLTATLRVALPARAIRARLSASIESPSWASYLPMEWLGFQPSDVRDAAPGQHSDAQAMKIVSRSHLGADQCGYYALSVKGGCISPGNSAGQHIFHASIPYSSLTSPTNVLVDTPTELQPGLRVGAALRSPTHAERAPKEAKGNTSGFAGQVWRLARDPQGCRDVQRALEISDNNEERAALAFELRGHVWEAVRCPHANHVIQKCITTMKPQASQFIIDELVASGSPRGLGGASQASRHRYGCRIVERLIEHCPPSQVKRLLDELIVDAMSLCRHPYGNYVMQHLLEHGPADHRQKLTRILEQHAHTVGTDCYARAVVSKALTHGARADQVALARALLREPGLIATMARTRHGHVAAKFALQHLDGADRQEACRQLYKDVAVLRASRYGRFVASCLTQLEPSPRNKYMLHGVVGGA